jgi:hypothetical protein
MTHTYRFGNADHTLVIRDDGATLMWPKNEDGVRVNVGNIPGGRLAEDFRLDDFSRKIAPYKESTEKP